MHKNYIRKSQGNGDTHKRKGKYKTDFRKVEWGSKLDLIDSEQSSLSANSCCKLIINYNLK